MKPIKFPEQNLTLKGDGNDVIDLHVWCGKNTAGMDEIISCWELMPLEKILLLFYNKIYFSTFTTKDSFPPICPQVENPFQPFTEPLGVVVDNIITRKVTQFVTEMDDDPLGDEESKALLKQILHGYSIWFINNMTKLEETKNETR